MSYNDRTKDLFKQKERPKLALGIFPSHLKLPMKDHKIRKFTYILTYNNVRSCQGQGINNCCKESSKQENGAT